MKPQEKEHQNTDTHLAKKYNDAIFNCMMECNQASIFVQAQPHFNYLVSYHAAVDTFFINTFFLFEGIKIETDEDKNTDMSIYLMKLMEQAKDEIMRMKKNPDKQRAKYFLETERKVSYAHKLIMWGLQKRNMLVRVSDREPSGSETIKYWNTKVGFKKGDLVNDTDINQGTHEKPSKI